MVKTTSFYVIKLEGDLFYRRNHESTGGIRPTSSIIKAEQFASLEAAKEKYNKLKIRNKVFPNEPKVSGIARFGLLKGECIDEQ